MTSAYKRCISKESKLEDKLSSCVACGGAGTPGSMLAKMLIKKKKNIYEKDFKLLNICYILSILCFVDQLLNWLRQHFTRSFTFTGQASNSLDSAIKTSFARSWRGEYHWLHKDSVCFSLLQASCLQQYHTIRITATFSLTTSSESIAALEVRYAYT
jgi:hypothetical protein